MAQPLGRANRKEFQEKWSFTPNELLLIKDTVNEWADKFEGSVELRRLNSLFLERKKNIYTFKCDAGRLTLSINEKGNVRPCAMMPSGLFNMGSAENVLLSIEEQKVFDFTHSFTAFEKILNSKGFSFNDLKCTGFCEECTTLEA